MPRTVIVLALGLAVACGSPSPAPGPVSDAARSGEATPTTPPGPDPAKTPPTKSPLQEPLPLAVPPPLPAEAVIDPLCNEILAPADVQAIIGQPATARAAPPGEPGTVACAVDIDLSNMKATSAVVDCTSDPPSIEQWRTFFEDAAQRNGGELREVATGKGGVYIKVPVRGMGVGHQIAFVHDQVPCTVRVNAGMFDEDYVTPLAEHVRSKLTADNRPHK